MAPKRAAQEARRGCLWCRKVVPKPSCSSWSSPVLRLYGLATIFVLSHMRMDIRMSQGLQLLTALRRMTISTGTLPLLLFSDPRMVCPVNVYDFPRPRGTSIASTAYPIRLEERHDSTSVLQSPGRIPSEHSIPGCPHRTRVCCDS